MPIYIKYVKCHDFSVTQEIQKLEEGTELHLLLVESLPVFYQWQDAVFCYKSQRDFEIKTRKLLELIKEIRLKMGATSRRIGKEQ